jgi:hypothetical protein
MAEYMSITRGSPPEGSTSRRKRRSGVHKFAENKLLSQPIDFVGHPAAFKKVTEESGRNSSYYQQEANLRHGSQLLRLWGREVSSHVRVYGLRSTSLKQSMWI